MFDGSYKTEMASRLIMIIQGLVNYGTKMREIRSRSTKLTPLSPPPIPPRISVELITITFVDELSPGGVHQYERLD